MNLLSKIISYVFHPVFVPMYGVLVYVNSLPIIIRTEFVITLLLMFMGFTLIMPLFLMVSFKFLGLIDDYNVKGLEERKLPVMIMALAYLYLGYRLDQFWQIKELWILCYATGIGLMVVYILLFVQFKTSLHTFGSAGLIGLCYIYGINKHFSVPLIACLILLTGVIGTARLSLKAHTLKEVAYGSVLGLVLPIWINYLL